MSPSSPRRPAEKIRFGYGSVVVLSLVAVVLAAGMIVLSRTGATSSVKFEPPVTKTPIPTQPPVAGDPASMGSPSAPVTIVEYEDFQCSICQTYSASTEKQLRAAYVDTGKVRIVYKNRIVYDEESIMAAMAAESAGEQGKFWPYHDSLMEMRFAHGQVGDITYEKLEEIARNTGLKMDMFSSSLRSGKYREEVMKDDAEGQAAEVTGTPTFFVNGGKAVGAPPFDVFQKFIDDLLQQASTSTTSPTAVVVSGTSIGSPRAPITIVEYSDYQCHFCENFANTIEPRIDAAYIQTGKVRFVYKHLVSFGAESQLAAEASEAAAEQNQFWPFHDALMQLQLSNSANDLSLEKVQAIAQQLGLNMTQFNASLTSGKFKAKVASDDSEGRGLGFTGIPAFFVNGVKAPDGVSTSFEEFQKVLDTELARLGR